MMGGRTNMMTANLWLSMNSVLRNGFAILLFASLAFAQSSLDKGTPVESKPGTSTPSTYAPDKIETVNLANGNLSMNVPLVNIGGRGSASFTVALSYNSKLWSTQHDKEETGNDPFVNPLPYVHHYYAWYNQGSMETPGRMALGGGWSIPLGPALKRRRINIGPHKCSNNHTTCYTWVLTKLSLIMPDGAEVELRDEYTQGAPHWIGSAPPSAGDRWRGRVWRSGDGSATTYVSDVDNGVVSNQLSGWVFLADGTRIRMEGDTWGETAHFTKIIDRNGNYITIDYTNPAGIVYTDQLGRQVIVNWAPPAPVNVTIKGYSGVPDRVIAITVQTIGALDGSGVANNLRSDFRSLPRPFTSGDYMRTAQGNWDHTIPDPHTDLFLGSESMEDIDGQYAVTRIDLLDGRSLRFRYNQFGEVAEVVYPGGGVSQIDYQGFQTSMCEGIAPYTDTLDRKVTQRRLLSNGANVDATWTYSGGTVEVHQGEQNGPLLSSETHYFMALKAEYKVCRFVQQTADVMADGTHYERWDNAKEYRVERQTGAGTEVTVRQWEQRTPVFYLPEPNAVYTQEQPANDPRVVWEETTLDNGRKKRTEYSYDDFNNVTLIKEYDFGGTDGSGGPLVRQTFRSYATALNGYCYSNLNPLDPSCATSVTTDLSSIIHQRRLLLNETIKDAAGNQKAYSEIEYDNYVADPQQNHAPVFINSGMIQYDGTQFGPFSVSNQPRGNPTRASHWAGGSNYIYSFSKYDNAGNVIWSKDPNGNVATASFADNFGDGGNPDVGTSGPNGATYSFLTLATNSLGHQAKAQFDYTRGVQTGAKDPNGVISKIEHDLLGRPVRQTAALGLAAQAITETSYATAGTNSSTVSGQLDATRWLSSKTVADGFDRVITALTAEDGQHASTATFSIRVDTVYDGLDRVVQVSNPYRPGAGEIARYTTTSYNLGSRVISITTPDNAVVTTSYIGNTVTVLDQTGKARKSVTDALGRLTEVYEDPTNLVYETTYSYDVLDNLTTVTEGSQTRTFGYDSLKRLTFATNPESGTVTYQYDGNGNLTQKTDARTVVSTYAYDALNRNTTIDYSDTSSINPDVSRFYDGATNGLGRLSSSYAGGTESVGSNVEKTVVDSYDALGRPTVQRQLFKLNGNPWVSYQTSRIYNRAGGVTSQTYPSGHPVNYSYDSAARTDSFSGTLGDGTNRTYSTGITYVSSGQMKQEQFGTTVPVYNKLFYNSRQQLAEILAGTSGNDGSWNRGKIVNGYSLNCSGANCNNTDNNGNLRKQEVFIPTNEQGTTSISWYQQYDYDNLNRLQRVHEYTGNPARLAAGICLRSLGKSNYPSDQHLGR